MKIDWQPIETAPTDGTQVLLYTNKRGYECYEVGSFRFDDNDHDESKGKLWLDNSYNDFSCGLASCPIDATHWARLQAPTSVGAA